MKAKEPKMISRIWTIGHSTRRIDIFLSLLEENGIKLVADVRMFPGSKRYPQFGRGALAESLGEHGLASLAGPTAIMCAEAVWWRCHRSLISDYLKARGVEVIHILGEKKTEPHPFTSAAQIVNGDLSYRPRSRR